MKTGQMKLWNIERSRKENRNMVGAAQHRKNIRTHTKQFLSYMMLTYPLQILQLIHQEVCKHFLQISMMQIQKH